MASLLITKLTIYNGRIGEEISRMTSDEYVPAKAKKFAKHDKYILVSLKGKGKRFVTVSNCINLNVLTLYY